MKTETKTEVKPTGLALLRAPFEKHQISKLPKPTSKDNAKGKCAECGGWHGLPAVHLDYVGHAALTDRLLEADPEWDWVPLAYDAEGLPKFDRNGGLWIRLTVCGKTRLGYGNTDKNANNGDAEKEIIGDALRNAAMRFGAALDLWHKGDLHASNNPEEEKPPEKPKFTPTPKPEAKPAVNVNPADYVVKVGKKYNGMALKNMLDQEIEGYIDYVVDGSKKTGKPLSGDWIEFVETAEKYLATKNDPKLNDEELPF